MTEHWWLCENSHRNRPRLLVSRHVISLVRSLSDATFPLHAQNHDAQRMSFLDKKCCPKCPCTETRSCLAQPTSTSPGTHCSAEPCSSLTMGFSSSEKSALLHASEATLVFSFFLLWPIENGKGSMGQCWPPSLTDLSKAPEPIPSSFPSKPQNSKCFPIAQKRSWGAQLPRPPGL